MLLWLEKSLASVIISFVRLFTNSTAYLSALHLRRRTYRAKTAGGWLEAAVARGDGVRSREQTAQAHSRRDFSHLLVHPPLFFENVEQSPQKNRHDALSFVAASLPFLPASRQKTSFFSTRPCAASGENRYHAKGLPEHCRVAYRRSQARREVRSFCWAFSSLS